MRADLPRIGDLVERFAAPVYRLALRMTGDPAEAEDVVQETFLLAERGLPRFDVERPVAPWLFKVATNACLTRCRARRRRRNHERRPPPFRDEEGRRPEAAVDTAEAREAVGAAVLELAPIYRAVVTLFYLKELSLEEVATTLGIPAGTAKVRLFRARALLAARLKAFSPGGETAARRPA